MANTSSAKKAIRSSERKKIINLRIRRTFREAIKSASKATDKDSMSKAFQAIDKAAKGKVIHKNTAARYKSALSKKAK